MAKRLRRGVVHSVHSAPPSLKRSSRLIAEGTRGAPIRSQCQVQGIVAGISPDLKRAAKGATS